MAKPEYVITAVGTAVGVPLDVNDEVSPGVDVQGSRLTTVIWTTPPTKNLRDRMLVEQDRNLGKHPGLPADPSDGGDGAEGISLQSFEGVSVAEAFEYLRKISDELAWGRITWQALGFPADFRPNPSDFKLIVVHMVTQLSGIVRDLGLDIEFERRVVDLSELRARGQISPGFHPSERGL